uniref:Uncharacterized protein n=1 Tax=Arundo donax TaxID=35708 RepID=A0A0A9AIR4_ARUDO
MIYLSVHLQVKFWTYDVQKRKRKNKLQE